MAAFIARPGFGVVAGLGLVALAFTLSLFRLENKNIWWDEGWSVWLARQDLGSIAATTAADEHPPLHYWFLHFWNGWAGETEFAVRFSSVIFAVLAVTLTYRLGRELWGRPWGLVAALLLAISRFHIWWSQEIKMYASAVFVALLSLYFFTRLLREPKARFWMGYVLANLAGLYLVYLHVFVLVIINLVFVVLWLRRWSGQPSWLAWLKANGMIALGFLPWLIYFESRARTWERLPPLDLAQFVKLYLASLPLGLVFNVDQVLPMALPFAPLAALGLVAAWGEWRKRQSPFGMVALMALVGFPVIIYVMSLLDRMPYHPKMAGRYFIIFLPVYVLVLTAGIRFLVRRWRFLGATALVGALMLGSYVLFYYYRDRHSTYDLSNMVSFVEAYRLPRDALVLNTAHDWPVIAYYNDEDLPAYRIPKKPDLTDEDVARILAPALSRNPSLWLVTTRDVSPQGAETVEQWLQARYSLVEEREYGSNTLTLWTQGADGHGLAQQIPLETDGTSAGATEKVGEVSLLGFNRMPEEVRTDDTLYVVSYWQAAADRMAGDFKVRLVLRDESGRTVIRRPAGNLSPFKGNGRLRKGQAIRTEQRLRIAAIPSGRFRVELEVEDAMARRRFTIPVGPVEVESKNWIAPQQFPLKRLEATWNDQLRLLGYHLPEGTFRRGYTIPLTLFWQPLAETDRNYLVVLRLMDSQGAVWLNWETAPLKGALPTSSWGLGEIIGDRYEVALKPDMPPGEYTLMVGFVDDETGDFLPSPGADPLADASLVDITRVKVE